LRLETWRDEPLAYRPNLVLWPAYAGPGPIGTDGSALAFASLVGFTLEPVDVHLLLKTRMPAMLPECAAGCDAAERLRREGFMLSGVLRWIVGARKPALKRF
jgi:hypothetical protein